jgi:hypothetical protein
MRELIDPVWRALQSCKQTMGTPDFLIVNSRLLGRTIILAACKPA